MPGSPGRVRPQHGAFSVNYFTISGAVQPASEQKLSGQMGGSHTRHVARSTCSAVWRSDERADGDARDGAVNGVEGIADWALIDGKTVHAQRRLDVDVAGDQAAHRVSLCVHAPDFKVSRRSRLGRGSGQLERLLATEIASLMT